MKYAILIVIFFSSHVYRAQNLVPNPSFEENTGCPEGYPDLDGNLNYWMSFRGTPDYFHNCSNICGYDNAWGYQEPHSGHAYTALWTYQPTTPEGCEHIGVQLTSPLVIGEKYHISFFVSSGHTPLLVNIATNKLGALFTTEAYHDNDAVYPLPNFAHIYLNTIVSDTVSWVKVSGSFIANEAYQYLAIGRFFDDSQIDTLHLPYSVVPQASCYYLDDICVSTDSLLCEIGTNTPKYELKNYISIYPNPTDDYITLDSNYELGYICIYNSLGTIVYHLENTRETRKTIRVTDFPKGMYIVSILSNDNRQDFKFIIN